MKPLRWFRLPGNRNCPDGDSVSAVHSSGAGGSAEFGALRTDASRLTGRNWDFVGRLRFG